MDIFDSGTNNPEITNSTTEITLSHDQWQLMERNGWVLLESNGKMYLLDTIGLHDITDNVDLIQSLKNESAISTWQQLPKPETPTENDVLALNDQQPEVKPTLLSTLGSQETSSCEDCDLNGDFDKLEEVNMTAKNAAPVSKPKARTVIVNKSGVAKFNTSMNAEEIPEKLVLGITVNGKKLVARRVKKPKTIDSTRNNTYKTPVKVIASDEHIVNTDSEKARVDKFFKNYLRNVRTPPKMEDIDKAAFVINQLLFVESTRDRIMGQNILVTRISSNQQSDTQTPAQPTYVPGRVVNVAADQYGFQYESQLLHNIMTQNLNISASNYKAAIVHVHVEEVKLSKGGQNTTSITINKQNIRLLPMPRKLVHACPNCANLFETEQDLEEHRQKPCAEQKTLPQENPSKDFLDYYKEIHHEGSTAKSFVCIECNVAVMKRNLARHVATTHLGLGEKQGESEQELHECKICDSVFFHKSTLSKHLKNFHIKKNIHYTLQN